MKQSLQRAFAEFARNERWGTCVACPQDTNGVPYPEFCAYTDRYDHQLTGESLIETYHNYKGDKKPPTTAPQEPHAPCPTCNGERPDYGECGDCQGGKK